MQQYLQQLKRGAIGVIKTDTLYGVVATAFDHSAIERIYEIKYRDTSKPLLVLISDTKELSKFGIKISQKQRSILEKLWPNPITVILSVDDENGELKYLHRDTNAIAFRVPNDENLRGMLEEAGPLVAPSANPEGGEPATTIEKAKEYFGDSIDFYIDDGPVKNAKPSTLIRLTDTSYEIVREGVVSGDEIQRRLTL